MPTAEEKLGSPLESTMYLAYGCNNGYSNELNGCGSYHQCSQNMIGTGRPCVKCSIKTCHDDEGSCGAEKGGQNASNSGSNRTHKNENTNRPARVTANTSAIEVQFRSGLVPFGEWEALVKVYPYFD